MLKIKKLRKLTFFIVLMVSSSFAIISGTCTMKVDPENEGSCTETWGYEEGEYVVTGSFCQPEVYNEWGQYDCLIPITPN